MPELDADQLPSLDADQSPEMVAPALEFAADPVLLGATALAQQALLQITSPTTVGPQTSHRVDGEHVLTLFFAADVSGYPGWRWAVTLARVPQGEPTVSETELVPGDGALLAPEWVPWSVRLAEYHSAQAAAKAAGELVDEEFVVDDEDAIDGDADLDDDAEDEDRDDDFDEDDLEADFDDEFELNHDPDVDDEGFVDDEGDPAEEE